MAAFWTEKSKYRDSQSKWDFRIEEGDGRHATWKLHGLDIESVSPRNQRSGSNVHVHEHAIEWDIGCLLNTDLHIGPMPGALFSFAPS